MATIKVNGAGYFISSSKITTPSIKIAGQGYIPLFVGNKGSTVDYNRYRYTLGGLKIGNYHAATSREFINHAPTATLSASATRVANGTGVTLTCTASDPDGDSLGDFKWYTKVNGSWNNGGNFGSTRYVSFSDTTLEYYVVVTDPYGASVTTNTVSVTWYNPNHAPEISITNFSQTSSSGNIPFTVLYSDYDRDVCTIAYGYVTYGSGGIEYRHQTGSVSVTAAPSTVSGSGGSMRLFVSASFVGGSLGNNYRIYATITDSKGAWDTSAVTIGYAASQEHAYKCTVEYWKEQYADSGSYGPGAGFAWVVDITTNRCPSQYAGLRVVNANVNGNGIRYDGTLMKYDNYHKPSTITIQPYVIQQQRVKVGERGSYDNGIYHPVDVYETQDVWVAAGPTHTVSTDFPSREEGRRHSIKVTYEWD